MTAIRYHSLLRPPLPGGYPGGGQVEAHRPLPGELAGDGPGRPGGAGPAGVAIDDHPPGFQAGHDEVAVLGVGQFRGEDQGLQGPGRRPAGPQPPALPPAESAGPGGLDRRLPGPGPRPGPASRTSSPRCPGRPGAGPAPGSAAWRPGLPGNCQIPVGRPLPAPPAVPV